MLHITVLIWLHKISLHYLRETLIFVNVGVGWGWNLAHCIRVVSSSVICWTSPFVILGGWVYFVIFILFLMENPVTNNLDPAQMPHNVASELALQCLPKYPF